MVMSQSNMANITYGQTVTIQPDAMMSNATGTQIQMANCTSSTTSLSQFMSALALALTEDSNLAMCLGTKSDLGKLSNSSRLKPSWYGFSKTPRAGP
ncbi:hypothetical protein M408DRAFT_163613 [Serendipita vermifera MAFF 305830]|uniref:Uncharacterized protein n=1 Tax=Serendipita vermifera MAFF 305830 TaxID=933852 RepID=A0A0C3B8D8_SERVB|nr:hypothetical protein M408DRAFT_163613 [Serendipita vermifera MAFF 305830]